MAVDAGMEAAMAVDAETVAVHQASTLVDAASTTERLQAGAGITGGKRWLASTPTDTEETGRSWVSTGTVDA